MNLLPLVLKNVLRKRTRAILTVGAIVLPLFVICFMATVLRAMDSDSGAETGAFRLVTRHRVSLTSLLPRAHEAKIRALPGVVAATTLNMFGGTYVDSNPRNVFMRFATEPAELLRVFDDMEIVAGSKEDWLADRMGCMVGANLAQKFGWKIGDPVVLQGSVFPGTLELKVRAVYYLRGGTSASLYFNRATLDEAHPWFKGQAFVVIFRARDAAASDALLASVDGLFENSVAPTRTETENAFKQGFVSMLGNVKLALSLIGTVIMFVVLLIAANTMAMAARERVTEIAVLRTLGFPRPAILGMVLGEGMVLGVLGGLLGGLLFIALEPTLKRVILESPAAMLAGAMRVYPDILARGFGLAVGVGLLAGLVPAVRSAQRSIVDGLRQAA